MKTRFAKVVVVAFIVMAPVMAFSQVQFNLKQGMVVSTLSNIGDLTDNNHPALSFTAGGFAVIPLGNVASFQPEINYIRKGRFEKINTSGTTIKNSLTSDYIQIPLLFRLTPSDLLGNSQSKFFFTTGFYESILLHAQQYSTSGDITSGSNITGTNKKSDLGFILGGGVQFPFRQKLLQVELRYDMGLTKISDQLNNYHTKALSLTLGMAL